MSTRRKLAIATWSAPREGNIYGKLTVDATHALAYLDKVRAETGEKVTITHFVGKVVAAGVRRPGAQTDELTIFVLHRTGMDEFLPKPLNFRRLQDVLAQRQIRAAV